MKHNFRKIVLTAILIAAAFVLTGSAQTSPCAEFRNKTYIAFNEAKFDDYPNAAGAFRVKFNIDGTVGTARFLTAYTPEAPNALQQAIVFTCKKSDHGGGYFDLTVGNTKTSAGGLFFKSFDRGARIWVKSNIPNRDTPLWMIELPVNPIDEHFPKTR